MLKEKKNKLFICRKHNVVVTAAAKAIVVTVHVVVITGVAVAIAGEVEGGVGCEKGNSF